MTFPGEMSDTTPCALSYDFYQEKLPCKLLRGRCMRNIVFLEAFLQEKLPVIPLCDGTGAVGAGPAGLPGIATSKVRADAALKGPRPTCCSAGRWDRLCRYAPHSAARAGGGPAPMSGPHSV